MGGTLDQLRASAVRRALPPLVTLGAAVTGLGFVQADPIRAPARAQDLILRQRVAGYRSGDLDRRFARLGLEEDFLYAYGFMPGETRQLLHPRPDAENPEADYAPRGLAAEVWGLVCGRHETHPRDLEAAFGRNRAVNAWGGFSKETTQALQELHYHGLLRVVRRQDGIRIYAVAGPVGPPLPAEERKRRLLMLLLSIFAPISLSSLKAVLNLVRRGAPALDPMAPVLDHLLTEGLARTVTLDRECYVMLQAGQAEESRSAPRGVRFLAPFDPLVWDRRRFAHFWGWTYRFEAYTPPDKRQFGYYALPLLWQDAVIGWVNAGLARGRLTLERGFIGSTPQGRDFARAFDAEAARLEQFLNGT